MIWKNILGHKSFLFNYNPFMLHCHKRNLESNKNVSSTTSMEQEASSLEQRRPETTALHADV